MIELHLHYLLVAVIAVLSIGILFGLIQTIRGPRRADRVLGINMIGSLSLGLIAVLAVFLKESWFLDVCLVYCLISFLAVVVLSKIHIAEKDDFKEEIEDIERKGEAHYE